MLADTFLQWEYPPTTHWNLHQAFPPSVGPIRAELKSFKFLFCLVLLAMGLSPIAATDPGGESLQDTATDKSTTPRGDDNESAPAPTTAAAAATIDTIAEQGKMGRTHSKEVELQRKRARDRKSQQAMRNRTKWTIQSLTDQVGSLTSAVDQRARDLSILEARARNLEAENAQLRTQNAALQLSLMAHRQQTDNSSGSNIDDISAGSPAAGNTSQSHYNPIKGVNVVPSLPLPLWELVPNNTAPGCLADDILQTFVDKTRADRLLSAVSPMTSEDQKRGFPPRLDPRSLLGGERIRSDDQVSDVVAGIVKAYEEIQGLPRQVAVFFNMTLLVKVSLLFVIPNRGGEDAYGCMGFWVRG